jgi:hypothetical protein
MKITQAFLFNVRFLRYKIPFYPFSNYVSTINVKKNQNLERNYMLS